MADWADVATKGSDYLKKLEQYKQNAFSGGATQAFSNKLTPSEQNRLTAGLCGHTVNTAASGG